MFEFMNTEIGMAIGFFIAIGIIALGMWYLHKRTQRWIKMDWKSKGIEMIITLVIVFIGVIVFAYFKSRKVQQDATKRIKGVKWRYLVWIIL